MTRNCRPGHLIVSLRQPALVPKIARWLRPLTLAPTVLFREVPVNSRKLEAADQSFRLWKSSNAPGDGYGIYRDLVSSATASKRMLVQSVQQQNAAAQCLGLQPLYANSTVFRKA